MSHDTRCPRCEGQVFHRIDRAESPDHPYSSSFRPLGLTGAFGDSGESGLHGSPKVARVVVDIERFVDRRYLPLRGCFSLRASRLDGRERTS